MKVNSSKTKTMIFNYTDNYQFATRLMLDDKPLETVSEIKLLGTIITSDLKWDKNTSVLTKRAYSRMRLLHKMIEFGYTTEDLIHVYILYLRSLCEQSAVVWHSSLTVENEEDIERVQKTALKIIFKTQYKSYDNALVLSGLKTLKDRRKDLCLTFAKRCLKNDKTSDMFPLNNDKTKHEKYKVYHANTSRLQNSPIIYMQHLLNE